ncbi:MAG: flagellar hook-associated protein FlgK [Pseudomonas sp.]
MSSLLATGTSALRSYQRSLGTIGNNVANATTPGYSRQVAELASRDTGGVHVQDIKRMTDALATGRVLDSTGELNRLEQLSGKAGDLDTLMSDSATNLSGTWSSFFDGLSELGANPASDTARKAVLQNADALAGRFRQLDSAMDGMASDVDAALADSVRQVNDLASQIAELNRQIARGTADAPETLDKRDLLVEQLIGLTGGTTFTQDDGSINLYTSGGQALVVGVTPMTLAAVSDPYQSGRLNLALQAQGQTIPLGNDVLGGKLGGLLDFRSDVLDPARSELGRLAVALSTSINQAQAAGTDIYGDAGADLFSIDPPEVSAHASNTGAATLQASVSDIGQLDGTDVVLRFDGSAWSAADAATGAALTLTGTGASGDPLVVDGVEVEVSGAAAAGDRFLLRPSRGAGTLQLAVGDPGLVAAARAVQGSADLDNIGNATVASLTVTDADNAALRTASTIEFTDSNQYTIDGEGPYSYSAGDTIAANGWSFKLDGAPAAGDVFSIAATGPGSSDNANVLNMAVLDEAKLLSSGTLSLNGALASFTTTVASAAAQSNYAYESEQTIHNQAVAARDSVSGVNLDEEAADLIKYQQAYQAAAKIIASADNIFQSLLQAV